MLFFILNDLYFISAHLVSHVPTQALVLELYCTQNIYLGIPAPHGITMDLLVEKLNASLNKILPESTEPFVLCTRTENMLTLNKYPGMTLIVNNADVASFLDLEKLEMDQLMEKVNIKKKMLHLKKYW